MVAQKSWTSVESTATPMNLGIRDVVKSTDFKFQKMDHEINYCTQIK